MFLQLDRETNIQLKQSANILFRRGNYNISSFCKNEVFTIYYQTVLVQILDGNMEKITKNIILYENFVFYKKVITFDKFVAK